MSDGLQKVRNLRKINSRILRVVYNQEHQKFTYILRDVSKVLWVLSNKEWARDHLQHQIDEHSNCVENGCEFIWEYDTQTDELIRGPHHYNKDKCNIS